MGNKQKLKIRDFRKWGLFALLFLGTLLIVHLGSRPEQYNLQINEVSPYDIEAPRSVVNRNATEKRAQEAKSQVANVFTRSEELAAEILARSKEIWGIISDQHQELVEARNSTQKNSVTSDKVAAVAESLAEVFQTDYDLEIDSEDLATILGMSESRFQVFSNKFITAADTLMSMDVDESELPFSIREYFSRLNSREMQYLRDTPLLRDLLSIVLDANVIYNEEATKNAMNSAYDRVLQNPIIVNRGTRLVSSGQIVTSDIYDLLIELNLVENKNFDFLIFAGQALLILIVLAILFIYYDKYEKNILDFNTKTLGLIIAIYVPLILTAYLGQDYQLAPPVYFTAILLSAYFSIRTAVISSACLIVLCLPLVNFNPAFVVVGICGSVLASFFARSDLSQDNFTRLVIILTLTNVLSSLSYVFTQGRAFSGSATILVSILISTLLSVIGAVGLLPLMEILFAKVSPAKLIELSQPGQPLLKRLFLEAPGTSQHSLMVANLADAAAEAIGADALVCRVGAYYHDIGKLKNPTYFTENQGEYNPHDQLDPLASTEIITSHTRDGLALGREYKLPQPILDIIVEHHGTTVLGYFYATAQKEAEERGEEAPNPELFRYAGPLPSSRESAVVMLADSTEAAIKSLKSRDLQDALKMIDSVFRIKLEQDQFKNSGLRFEDIDKIKEAFLQVYSGHFHERIEYPENENQIAAASLNEN